MPNAYVLKSCAGSVRFNESIYKKNGLSDNNVEIRTIITGDLRLECFLL